MPLSVWWVAAGIAVALVLVGNGFLTDLRQQAEHRDDRRRRARSAEQDATGKEPVVPVVARVDRVEEGDGADDPPIDTKPVTVMALNRWLRTLAVCLVAVAGVASAERMIVTDAELYDAARLAAARVGNGHVSAEDDLRVLVEEELISEVHLRDVDTAAEDEDEDAVSAYWLREGGYEGGRGGDDQDPPDEYVCVLVDSRSDGESTNLASSTRVYWIEVYETGCP